MAASYLTPRQTSARTADGTRTRARFSWASRRIAEARLARTERSDANARALIASESRISASAMSCVRAQAPTSAAVPPLLRAPRVVHRRLRAQAHAPSHEQQSRKVRVLQLVCERQRLVRWERLPRASPRADPYQFLPE